MNLIELSEKFPNPVKSESEIVALFLSEISVKEKSKRAYRNWINYYINWAKSNNIYIGNATRSDLIKYGEFLNKESGLSKSSVGSYLVIIRKLYAWFHANGAYQANIGIGIRSPKIGKEFKKRGLNSEQVSKLLDWSQSNQSLRDYAIICLFAYTGLREMSVAAANIDDIKELADNRVIYYLSKGHDEKDKHVVLIDEVWLPIEKYLHQKGIIQIFTPLFTSESKINKGKRLNTRTLINIVREALDAIGLYSQDKYYPHSLRHSCGQNLLRAGATIEQVQWILGHEDISTTMTYVKYIEDERRSQNAPERLLSGFFKRNPETTERN